MKLKESRDKRQPWQKQTTPPRGTLPKGCSQTFSISQILDTSKVRACVQVDVLACIHWCQRALAYRRLPFSADELTICIHCRCSIPSGRHPRPTDLTTRASSEREDTKHNSSYRPIVFEPSRCTLSDFSAILPNSPGRSILSVTLSSVWSRQSSTTSACSDNRQHIACLFC